jgi:ABC-2 type transport system ATP-binding protein
MADRIGVINKGEMVLVEEKAELMRKLGKKQLTVELQQPLAQVPPELAGYALTLGGEGRELTYAYDSQDENVDAGELLAALQHAGLKLKDIQTRQSSLEDIFVNLVKDHA